VVDNPPPALVVCTSDLHCGSTVGLSPPTIRLDDGGAYEASKAQLWMWSNWLDLWERAEALRGELGADLYCVFNGDLVDGNHHGTTQILSGNPNAQAAAVNACMAVPLALQPKGLVFIRGTDVHVGQSASAEERIADGLRRDKKPVVGNDATGAASHWHFKMERQGVRLDFAHHGRVGTRPWTKPNVVLNLAAEIFDDHARDDARRGSSAPTFPHVAVRSHMHQFVDTHDAHPTRVVQMPGWQLASSFIHRIAPGKLADIGGVFLVIDRGAVTVKPIRYTPEPTKTWRP
jgi:hypothetical protein